MTDPVYELWELASEWARAREQLVVREVQGLCGEEGGTRADEEVESNRAARELLQALRRHLHPNGPAVDPDPQDPCVWVLEEVGEGGKSILGVFRDRYGAYTGLQERIGHDRTEAESPTYSLYSLRLRD